jgi:PAS domain S-box-containing protein
MRYHDPSDQCKNLYRFIRLVFGEDVSDREIARRWGMDEKNLRELKNGLRVVPKLSRLEDLAETLGVRKYYVLEVASGVPADKVYHILRNYVVEDQLSHIETAFAGPRSSEASRELVRAGLDSALHLAYRTLEPEQLFTKVARELKKHKFESHIFFLDQESGSATIKHSSFSPRLLHVAENVTGLSLMDFRFPLQRVPSFQTCIDARSPVYLPDASVLLYQILGERQLRRFVEKMMGMFRILEVVLAPITVQGRVTGVFATGRNGELDESCLPEVRSFSEHLSYSLENAFIFQQVKQSEDRLRSLFDNLPEGVFACDEAGRIVQMNSAGANILGLAEPQSAVGMPMKSFRLLSPNAKAVREHIKKSKKVSVQNHVGVAMRKDGSPFLADITVRTEYDRRGAVSSTEGVFRDVSQRIV